MTDKATDVTAWNARAESARSSAPSEEVSEHIETLNWLSGQYLPGGPRDVKGAIRAAIARLTAHSGEGRENDKPPSHWAANDKCDRHPQSAKEWDWHADSPGEDSCERSIKRLNFAVDRGDPDAPNQMALVLRVDLSRVLGRLVHYTAHRELLMQKQAGEGRSNGAERDRYASAVRDLAKMDHVSEALKGVLFDCADLLDEKDKELVKLRALSAPQGEVERLRAEIADYRKLTREQQKRIGKLEGAIMARPPVKPDDGSWWYPEGDTSSDACCHGPAEALEAPADEMADGEARVVVLERALELPNVYAALRVFTDAERDERDDDEPWDFTLHATHDEARAALAQPEAGGE